MKKKAIWHRAVILFLLLAILTSCQNGGAQSSEESSERNQSGSMTAEPDGPQIVIADRLGSDYVIVVPASDGELYDIGYRLSQVIFEQTGTRLQVLTDSYREQEKEILLGNTNREVGDFSAEINMPRDYLFKQIGSKICIFGERTKAIAEAVEVFSSRFLSEEKQMLAIPESLHLVCEGRVELLNFSSSPYEIVYGSDAASSVTLLKNELERLTGKEWKIVSSASAEASDYQILLGKTGRVEAVALQAQCDSVMDYRIAAVGQKLVVAAGGKDGVALAVRDLIAQLKNSIFKGEIIMAADDSFSHDYGKANAQELISKISNNPEYVTSKSKLNIETARIFTPSGSTGWYYTHHPFITKFNGKFYAFYSSGRANEDDCGQRIMMATSSDFTNWNVSILVDSIQGEASELVCYCKGCYVYNNTMTVFFQDYEYAASTLRQNTDGTPLRPLEENAVRNQHGVFYLQTTDGIHWSDPISMGTVYGGNLSPVALQSGKLMWAGYGSLSVSSDPTAIGTWSNTRLQLDSSSAKPKVITESGFYQTKDGVIYLMSRTNDEYTYIAASFDDGASWTDMYPSKFVDTSNKFEMGTLPNGKYYYLGGISKKRSEIILMVSSDGVHFNTWYYLADGSYTPLKTGLYKSGTYGYMTSYFDSEYMYVIYSLYKESLEILRVPLNQIGC